MCVGYFLVKSSRFNVCKNIEHTQGRHPLPTAAVPDVLNAQTSTVFEPVKGAHVKSVNFDTLISVRAARKQMICGPRQLCYYQNFVQANTTCDPTYMAIVSYQPLVKWTIDAHIPNVKQANVEVPEATAPIGSTTDLILMLATKAVQKKQEVKEVVTPKPRTRLGLNKIFLCNLVTNQKTANDRRSQSLSSASRKSATSPAQAPTSVTPKGIPPAQSTPPTPPTPTPSRRGTSSRSKPLLSGGVCPQPQ